MARTTFTAGILPPREGAAGELRRLRAAADAAHRAHLRYPHDHGIEVDWHIAEQRVADFVAAHPELAA